MILCFVNSSNIRQADPASITHGKQGASHLRIWGCSQGRKRGGKIHLFLLAYCVYCILGKLYPVVFVRPYIHNDTLPLEILYREALQKYHAYHGCMVFFRLHFIAVYGMNAWEIVLLHVWQFIYSFTDTIMNVWNIKLCFCTDHGFKLLTAVELWLTLTFP